MQGLYGMNFVGEDDAQDQMKELHWKYGYLMFWLVSGGFTLGMIILMWRMGTCFSTPYS